MQQDDRLPFTSTPEEVFCSHCSHIREWQNPGRVRKFRYQRPALDGPSLYLFCWNSARPCSVIHRKLNEGGQRTDHNQRPPCDCVVATQIKG